MPSFKFVLPIKPISVNKLYGVRRGRKVLTEDARKFKLKAHELVKQQWSNPPLKCKVSVDLEFHFKTKRERDVDNYVKGVFDALTGLVIEDDKQIQQFTAKKFIDAQKDEVYIYVTPVTPVPTDKTIKDASAAKDFFDTLAKEMGEIAQWFHALGALDKYVALSEEGRRNCDTFMKSPGVISGWPRDYAFGLITQEEFETAMADWVKKQGAKKTEEKAEEHIEMTEEEKKAVIEDANTGPHTSDASYIHA